jgi:hypothetical protein
MGVKEKKIDRVKLYWLLLFPSSWIPFINRKSKICFVFGGFFDDDDVVVVVV